jgi:hypothetical protein
MLSHAAWHFNFIRMIGASSLGLCTLGHVGRHQAAGVQQLVVFCVRCDGCPLCSELCNSGELAQTPDGPPNIAAVATDGAWPWKRLRGMTIGPFRGFRMPEPFDLQKRVVLFYGPNCSGESSFCEGLEFGLLGSVEEAETKRIDGRTYLANLHARRFEAPALRATDHQNREVAVVANADTFRFCFIEKNRIDALSRIAARGPRRSALG